MQINLGQFDRAVRVIVVDRTLHRQGGNVIVPAFAVGRTQEILYHLHRLAHEGKVRDLRVFVDSPMATQATRITQRHLGLFDEAAARLAGWHAAGKDLPYLHFVASVEESMALNRVRSGAVIISASGICDAGRIRHHRRHNLGRRECSVLITGFQAQGALGRRLPDGAGQVRIFGKEIPVRAAIHAVNGLSAHADQHALLAMGGGLPADAVADFRGPRRGRRGPVIGRWLARPSRLEVTVPEPGQRMQWNGRAGGKPT